MSGKEGVVVLVDDDQLALTNFATMFGRYFDIHTYPGAKEALEGLKTLTNVDVIISDEVMPSIRGHELLINMKKLYPHIQRIVTTAYTDQESLLACYQIAEARSFLRKPWEDSFVLRSVRDAIKAKAEIERFNTQLSERLQGWQKTILQDRYRNILKILEVCGFQDPLKIRDSFFAVLEHIGIHNDLDWTDANLFDEYGEHELSITAMERMSTLNAPPASKDGILLKDFKDAIKSLDAGSIKGDAYLVIHPEYISLLYSAAQLAKASSFKRWQLDITIENGKDFCVVLQSDGEFGYGFNNVLCGYEKETVMRNCWLLNVVARVIESHGTLKFERSTESISARLVMPRIALSVGIGCKDEDLHHT